MNYTYVPLPLVEEASSVSASAQVLVIDDGEVKRTDAANIGIKPTGKINISENGTDIDVSQYATADVNVSGGSSDFSTAEVTITLGSGVDSVVLTGPLLYDDGGELFLDTSWNIESSIDAEGTLNAIIYGEQETYYAVTTDPTSNVEVTATGDVSYSDGYLAVSGNGTATFVYTK